jgi:hypothetical protein
MVQQVFHGRLLISYKKTRLLRDGRSHIYMKYFYLKFTPSEGFNTNALQISCKSIYYLFIHITILFVSPPLKTTGSQVFPHIQLLSLDFSTLESGLFYAPNLKSPAHVNILLFYRDTHIGSLMIGRRPLR